ncbi:MAG: response regulator [Lachnospiraceae bacterium]|nr:response regulator [Lachnospiraceae bacterium]
MTGQHTPQILIVDDTEVNRLILHSLLTSHGIEADMAESGHECLELCRSKRYDLILMDHRMPDMDGVDTLIALKELFRGALETPVICHTSEDVKANRNLYLAAGFSDVLSKPVDLGQLSEILATFLPGEISVDEFRHGDQQKLKEELLKLPDFLAAIPELDLASGIKHCQTADDLLEVMTVFTTSIQEKAQEIERFVEEKNWEFYTLKVHSLKSMLRLIGAMELADLAAALEHAGRQEDTAAIIEHTPRLLEAYRALLPALAQLVPQAAGKEALQEIDEAMLQDAYMAISEFASCYDMESIQMVLSSLTEYHLQERELSKLETIKSALSHMDWEGIRIALEK